MVRTRISLCIHWSNTRTSPLKIAIPKQVHNVVFQVFWSKLFMVLKGKKQYYDLAPAPDRKTLVLLIPDNHSTFCISWRLWTVFKCVCNLQLCHLRKTRPWKLKFLGEKELNWHISLSWHKAIYILSWSSYPVYHCSCHLVNSPALNIYLDFTDDVEFYKMKCHSKLCNHCASDMWTKFQCYACQHVQVNNLGIGSVEFQLAKQILTPVLFTR